MINDKLLQVIRCLG